MRVLYLQIAVGIIAIIGLFGSILPFLISARSNELFIFGVAVLVIFPILFASWIIGIVKKATKEFTKFQQRKENDENVKE